MQRVTFFYRLTLNTSFLALTGLSLPATAAQQLISDYDKNLCLVAAQARSGSPLQAQKCDGQAEKGWIITDNQLKLASLTYALLPAALTTVPGSPCKRVRPAQTSRFLTIRTVC